MSANDVRVDDLIGCNEGKKLNKLLLTAMFLSVQCEEVRGYLLYIKRVKIASIGACACLFALLRND